jgi:transcriptional coactivator HFI1/ADA1
MADFDATFNPATLARSDTVTTTASTIKAPATTPKSSKASHSYPRIDYEPLYTELKSLISDNWSIYYDALTRFLRGD